MPTAALVLGALLAAAAVWFVARPLLGRDDDPVAEPAPERIALEEQRDRALAALKELEFDHRTGKISDEDYRSLVGELRRDAANALRALDAGKARTAQQQTEERMETRIERARREGGATEAVEPTPVPEPGPTPIPEPGPVPSDPPGPVIVPEPEPPDPPHTI